jgi:signal transduction histidine kinase
MIDRIVFLQSTELFQDMKPEHLREIGDMMQEMVLEAGAVVFEVGDPGDALYIVVEGQLKVTNRGVVLFHRGTGACLGEMALLDESPRSASVIAETKVRLLRWSRQDFLNVITTKTHIAFGLFKVLNTKLRQDVTIQVNHILELESRVKEKTRELEEANVRIKEQSERKSNFLAAMSHELRTPLNAIRGFASLVLRKEETLSDRGQENLEKVDKASDHLLAMINDLLDLSKIEAGRMDVNPVTFEAKHLIAYCVSTVSPLVKEGVELNYEVDVKGKTYTDEVRLRQMTINLLSNAIKFTDVGEVKLRLSQDKEMLEIAVRDTGKGIPEDELPTIFDEYRQVKGDENAVQKGTGLGLSITKKFAELLGGTIAVESKVGKGSIFTVRIPAVYKG